MKEYFSHAAYNRWYRQYQINLSQIRTQFDALRLPVETIPFPEHTRFLLESEIDEIDIQVEKIFPRNFMLDGRPLVTSEVFVENCKLIANFFLRLFRSSFSFESIYAKEKRSVLRRYHESNIKGKLSNLRRHIDEAIMAQMKTFSGATAASSNTSHPQHGMAEGNKEKDAEAGNATTDKKEAAM